MSSRRRWRVEYEAALISWIKRQRPSLLQIIAVAEWAMERKSLGRPPDAVPSPDAEYPEDELHSIPIANVDVLYLAYEGVDEDPLIFVRRFASH
jgi:hypothetical protein